MENNNRLTSGSSLTSPDSMAKGGALPVLDNTPGQQGSNEAHVRNTGLPVTTVDRSHGAVEANRYRRRPTPSAFGPKPMRTSSLACASAST